MRPTTWREATGAGSRHLRMLPSGAVIATYEPGGKVEHGWAGPQSTSEREQARQRAIAEGRW